MCCLKYEQEVYEEKLKKLPKVGSVVKTEDGEGTISSVEVLKEEVKVQFKKDDVNTYKNYKAKEVKVIKSSNQDVLSDSEKLEDLKELEALEKLEKEERKHVSNSEEE